VACRRRYKWSTTRFCARCRKLPEVRAKHPPKYGRKRVGARKGEKCPQRGRKRGNEDRNIADPPLPATPTQHEPGSEGKVAVLIERAARREALWHPGDAGMDRIVPRLPVDAFRVADD
jgi:hypothetical protein